MKTLVIEDQPLEAKMLARQLQASGYEATVCENAAAALQAYQQDSYAVVIMDLSLPDLDGIELCRRFRALPRNEQTMILVATGRDAPHDIRAAIEAGADDYLLKPIQLELLRVHLIMLEQKLYQVKQCKQMEAALRNSQEQLALITDGVPALIAYIDLELRYQYVNQAYADWYGYPAAAFIGKPLKAFLDESAYQHNLKYYYHVLMQGQRICFENTVLHQNGRKRIVTVDLVPHLDEQGNVKAFFGLTYDITEFKRTEVELLTYRQHLEDLVTQRTAELSQANLQLQQQMAERKRAERSVRSREQQYRLLAQKMTQGIALIQGERLVFGNQALFMLLGYAPGQPSLNRHVPDYALRTECVQRFFSECQEISKSKPGAGEKKNLYQTRQIACVTYNGREIWTERQYRRMEWEGEPAILVTVEDITVNKRQEQEMREAQVLLQREKKALRAALQNFARFGEIIGKSDAMQEVYKLIVNASVSDANTIIYGESGTGKELAARTIHQMSERKDKPFVVVNCGAIPENLFESEFFGHRKGAFSGADTHQAGYFEAAQGGALFLDEIGELTPAQQVKLLRVLENREYTPVGENRSRKSDVRIIAATNKNLVEQRQKGLIRDDFFYRIHVVTITLPPLRERKEDIPLLIEHFLKRHSNGHTPPRIPEVILEAMSKYHWPGNVRELQNELQRYLAVRNLEFLKHQERGLLYTPGSLNHAQGQAGLFEAVEAYEKHLIATILAQNQDNTAQSAQILGIPLRTLQRKIKTYQIGKHGS